jgi:23S rRNA (guanine2445-N2)-methyltransferase / 23S rRNA (guanine2069-N7)-methyltransferase
VQIAAAQGRVGDLPPDSGRGLIACNPPYGVRIAADVRHLLTELGEATRRRPAWRVAIVAADARMAAGLGRHLVTLLRTKSGGIPIEMLISNQCKDRARS